MTEKLESKHLLWWIFEIGKSHVHTPNYWDKTAFDAINAPDWVWKAFEQKKKEWANQ